MYRGRLACLICCVLIFLANSVARHAAAASAEELPRVAVPDDGRIVLADYGYRDWGPELVRYRLDTNRFSPGRLALVAEGGGNVPFQIERVGQSAILKFVAAVIKGKATTYVLKTVDSDRSRQGSTITHRAGGNAVEIGNAQFTVRLPSAQKRTFAPAVTADQVPPPILAWKQAGSDWLGRSRFFTDRKVAALEIRAVDDGPVTVAYECRYTFEPGGLYVIRLRVVDGVPGALVNEEFDFGQVTEGKDFLMVGLGQEWRPEQIGFLSGEGIGATCPAEPLGPYLAKKANEQRGALSAVGSYVPPSPSMPGKNLVLLEKITPGNTWGGFKGGCELRGTAQGEKQPFRSTWALPLHVGSWRRAMGLTVWNDPGQGVQLALPIGVRTALWYLDMADDRSPFSSHEHDPGLPSTYGRREWVLGAGPVNPATVRVQLGCIGLDRYKDWILDWPDDRSKAVYPRGLMTPQLVARLKQNLQSHPERELLEKLYLFDGKKESALVSAKRAIDSFTNSGRATDWQVVGLSSYYSTYHHLWTLYANDALACPELPADLRGQLRRHLALYAYLFSDPDFNPRGSGCHLGNPNMPIGRSMALATMAPLLPDHPRYAYWMNQLKTMAVFRLASNTEPGGAWFEPPIYQIYGPTRALSIAQIALRNCGFGDLAAEGWHKGALTYDAQLTMPDVRFKGWRIFPGMGNSGNTLEGIFGISMGVVEAADRDFAGQLRTMHRLLSGNGRVSQGNEPDYSFCLLPDVPEKPFPLKTVFVPGYGVAFRAHYGSADETAMLFRSGYNKSHWDMDDLNVILYGQGAPLSPGTGYQYYSGPASQNEGIYHNRVKVGRLEAHEPFGRIENHIQDYGFGDWVDYAVGREYYPPEYFADGKGDMQWRRHVLFVKSQKPEEPNYFVLRDTFPGDTSRSTWWHWLNLDGPDQIAASGNTIEMKTRYGAGTHFWFARPQSLDAKPVLTFDYPLGPNYHHRAFGKQLGVPTADDKETKTIVRVSGKPGEDYFYVVYPHKNNQPLPQFSQAGEGCILVKTAQSRDYLFASDLSLNFDKDNVVFSGKAGAVRVFPDRIVLTLASGSGRVGYKGYVLEGSGPLERVVTRAELKRGVVKVGGTEKQIVSVDLGNGVTVTGEGPFEARLDGQSIRIATRGRPRVLDVTLPAFITRPQLTVDGRQWMAGWSDYGGSDWGRMARSFLAAVTAPEGEHELVISDMKYPAVWDRPFVPTLGASR